MQYHCIEMQVWKQPEGTEKKEMSRLCQLIFSNEKKKKKSQEQL